LENRVNEWKDKNKMAQAGKSSSRKTADVHKSKKITVLPQGNIVANEDTALPPRMAINFEFGRRFRKAMAEKGVRQIDVAEATGIGRDSISGYTRGRVLPSGDRLKELCDFLGTTPANLVPAYGVDEKAADLMPAFEFKQSEQAGMAWLRINQTVSLEQVSRIMEILKKS
jgi:transcriptional regulator with XRE-family HTH domain